MTYINLNDFDAMLFDLDGTLADSMHIWKDIDFEFLSMFNLEMPENLQNEIEGMSFYQTAVYFKETFNLEWSLEEIMDCWNKMAYEHYTKVIQLKPGVLDFLKILKENNIKTAIGTSNSRSLTEAFLEANGVAEYFNEIVTAKEVTLGKPAPDVYLYAADLLKVDNHRCLVFEDLPAGILAGKAAKMTVCAVEDTYSEGLREEKIKLSDIYLKTFTELCCTR